MNKGLRYLSAVLSFLLVIPLFLNCWSYKVEGSKKYVDSWGLFGGFNELRVWKDFSSVWTILFGICAILLVLATIAIAVVFILNEMKDGNFFAYEKQLSNGYLVLSLLTAVLGAIVPLVYSKNVSANGFSAVDTLRHTIIPAIGYYMIVVLAFACAIIFISIAVDYKKNKNKNYNKNNNKKRR